LSPKRPLISIFSTSSINFPFLVSSNIDALGGGVAAYAGRRGAMQFMK